MNNTAARGTERGQRGADGFIVPFDLRNPILGTGKPHQDPSAGRERSWDAGVDLALLAGCSCSDSTADPPFPNQILPLIPYLPAQHKHKLPFAAEGKGQPDFLPLSLLSPVPVLAVQDPQHFSKPEGC